MKRVLKKHISSCGEISDADVCLRIYYLMNTISREMTPLIGMSIKRSEISMECMRLGGKYLLRSGDLGYKPALDQIAANKRAAPMLIDVIRAASSPYPNVNNSTQSKSRLRQTSVSCSMCGGKGWIPGFKTPTYGDMSRYWCKECKEEVGASHSHDQCPSCRGTGKTTTIK